MEMKKYNLHFTSGILSNMELTEIQYQMIEDEINKARQLNRMVNITFNNENLMINPDHIIIIKPV